MVRTMTKIFSSLGLIAFLFWMNYLTPRPEEVRIISPNMETTQNAHSTATHGRTRDGLFWVTFKTSGTFFALDKIKIRTINCIDSLNTSSGQIALPDDAQERCFNFKGFTVSNVQKVLSKDSEWHFAGTSNGNGHGIVLDKDWSEPKLIFGLMGVLGSLSLLIFGFLQKRDLTERVVISALLIAAFFFRFYEVFILSPPQMTIFSDMGAYFHRGWELTHGAYEDGQLFQPVGFTLWSLLLRFVGGFDLFNWVQVFSSWGVVVLSYLIVRKPFGKLAGIFAVILAGTHIPLASFATFHLAENIYAFLITLCLYLIVKNMRHQTLRKYFIIGSLLSLAFYFKGNHAFFIPAFSLWLLYKDRQNLMAAFKKLTVMAMGCLVFVVPHLIWTGMHYSKPHLGPTAGALNFVEGKCPSKNNMDSTGSSWMSPLFVQLHEETFKKWPRPFTDEKFFWQEGFKCVAQNPFVLVESLRYINYLFFDNEIWPLMTSPVRAWNQAWIPFFNFFLFPFAMVGAIIMARRKDAFTEVSSLMMLTLFFTVWFFKSEMRFRIPFDAILVGWSSIGAAWALNAVALLWRRRQALAKLLIQEES